MHYRRLAEGTTEEMRILRRFLKTVSNGADVTFCRFLRHTVPEKLCPWIISSGNASERRSHWVFAWTALSVNHFPAKTARDCKILRIQCRKFSRGDTADLAGVPPMLVLHLFVEIASCNRQFSDNVYHAARKRWRMEKITVNEFSAKSTIITILWLWDGVS